MPLLGLIPSLILPPHQQRTLLGCYVHYPTISTDMIARVARRDVTFNNSASVARSPLRSFVKQTYYRAFARLYGWAGHWNDLVMVNSSWTRDHIAALWHCRPVAPRIVYPPCDTTQLCAIPLRSDKRRPDIVSVAQFRPEKNHALQLQSLRRLFDDHPEYRGKV